MMCVHPSPCAASCAQISMHAIRLRIRDVAPIYVPPETRVELKTKQSTLMGAEGGGGGDGGGMCGNGGGGVGGGLGDGDETSGVGTGGGEGCGEPTGTGGGGGGGGGSGDSSNAVGGTPPTAPPPVGGLGGDGIPGGSGGMGVPPPWLASVSAVTNAPTNTIDRMPPPKNPNSPRKPGVPCG